MKDIKDYLHLYLGCECKRTDGTMIYTLITASKDYDPQFFDRHGNLCVFKDYDFKLILHPLQDMTLSEAVEIYDELFPLVDMSENGKVVLIKNYCSKDGIYEEGKVSIMTDAPFVVACLKRGFDLFGLIESGLAIDSTKMQCPTASTSLPENI